MIRRISSKSFTDLQELRGLSLRSNHLNKIPTTALKKARHLEELDIEQNFITNIQNDAFSGMSLKRNLKFLDQNIKTFLNIDEAAFRNMPFLKILNLEHPKHASIEYVKFPDLTNTTALQVLKVTKIRNLTVPRNFCNQKKILREISISMSTMTIVPSFRGCNYLKKISLVKNKIDFVTNEAISGLPKLEEFYISTGALRHIDMDAFSHLPMLKKLYLSEYDFGDLPNLNGTTSLRELNLQQCGIKYLPDDFCLLHRNLNTLELTLNKLKDIPSFNNCTKLQSVHLGHNRIRNIGASFAGLRQLNYLKLSDNHIQTIEKNAFKGLTGLKDLYLDYNLISEIHEEAFKECNSLNALDVSNNDIRDFPARGLSSLLIINAKNNKKMVKFASQEDLPHVKKLTLDYPYHCCYFKSKVEKIQQNYNRNLKTSVLSSWSYTILHPNKNDVSDAWAKLERIQRNKNFSVSEGVPKDLIEPLLRELNNDTEIHFPGTEKKISRRDEIAIERLFTETEEGLERLLDGDDPKVAFCHPTPNAFYPCDDLMEENWLRVCAWVVFLLALFGNLTVLLILTANCGKLDVPRILIINLAIADLCLGIYLGFLAFVDVITFGDFRAYALEWQFSGSCQAAGFLAIFSSELSVYTLTIITIERYTTIKNSLYTPKRMTVKHTAIIMLGGWIFSIVIAVLPLIEGAVFNDYTKYCVCLPFDTDTGTSSGYLIFLLGINLIAFTVILVCYIKLYLTIRGSNAWNSGDSKAARRMALLVMTDFVCWFPISLVAFSAVFKNSIITDLWISKVFTIFVFPLNACANPFLYTIFSRQFRKDCMSIIKVVKEKSQYRDLTKSLLRIPLKGSTTYSTTVRRGSSCSWLMGRRSSSKNDEIRTNPRVLNSKIPTCPYEKEAKMSNSSELEYKEMLTSV